jgi:hypothetical protein
MFHRILVLFENEKVCSSALTFARELALRMDSQVTFLMLVDMPFQGTSFLGSKRNAYIHLEKRMAEKLSRFSSDFLKVGIEASVAFRVGAPDQEMLKFLAGRPAFQAIVWGSNEALPDKGNFRRDHWVNKIAKTLECPLLSVSSKTSTG